MVALIRAQTLIFCLLVCSPFAGVSFAQSANLGGDPPTTVYSPPPSALATPHIWDLESVRSAQGNVETWSVAERRRLGAVQFNSRTGIFRNALPRIEGYWAFFGDSELPGGIVEGRWSPPELQVQPSDALWLAYSKDRTLCGGHLDTAYAKTSQLSYLGANWLTEFDELDHQLEAAAPSTPGRALAAGETIAFSQSPTFRDFARFYPPQAMRDQKPGFADVVCLVRGDLSLRCATVAESEAGYGFGESAQRVMRQVSVEGTTNLGAPSAGACLPRRIQFSLAQ